jgi:hypothetical protein
MENHSQKRLKFAELAGKRVNRATTAIRMIGNLSNRANYEWTETDTKLILKELRKAIKEVEDRFLNNGSRSNDHFSINP